MAGVYQQQVPDALVRVMQDTYERAFTEVSCVPEETRNIFDELSPQELHDILFDKNHSPEARFEAAQHLVKGKHFKYTGAERRERGIYIQMETKEGTGGFTVSL